MFQYRSAVRATGAVACGACAAGLPILRVAGGSAFATAGFSVFPRAAVFAVLGAHLAVFALAAVHRRLVAFGVFLAAGHLLAILALATGFGVAILAMAAGMDGAGRMFFVITAGTGRLLGIGGWRRLSTAALLCAGRQPARESQK